jgi:hypothetical protein
LHEFYFGRYVFKLIKIQRFGLNNLILQTNERLIKSYHLIDLRKEMIKEFQEIIFTARNLHIKKSN